MSQKKFTVRVHPTALEAIEGASELIAERHSAEKAIEWVGKLFDAIDTLEHIPDRCPKAPENGKWGDEELYQLLFQEFPSTYRVLFTIIRDTVHVLQIRHGARRWLHEEDD